MKKYQRIYLDANVLIDLAQDPGEIGACLQEIVSCHPVTRAEPLFVTSELTFSEVLVRPFRDKTRDLAEFYLQASLGSHWLNVRPVSFSVLERAAVMRAMLKQLKLPDAIHVATAQINECTHFLTNDLAIAPIPEIAHPFRREKLPELACIRADIGTLSLILKELT